MTNRPIEINFTKTFEKALKKAPFKIKIAFRKRFSLFLQDHFHPQLNNHALIGELAGYRCINITGDWRAIYSIKSHKINKRVVIFELLGTHSQLYR